MTDLEVYGSAALVGAVSGMRSMSAPAVLGQLARSGAVAIGHSGIDVLSRPVAAHGFTALAVAEAVADKLPFMPDRTKAISLTGRAITGAVTGAAVCSAKKRPLIWGALIGAAAAVGTAYGMYRLRKRAAKTLHIPNVALGLAEDALVAAAGWCVASRLRTVASA
ncbi:MAG: DUF4126 family protein [Acidobacteriaceae bacterium]|nr:DUF4126 family protein [Acidobacteriaceae bacterium]